MPTIAPDSRYVLAWDLVVVQVEDGTARLLDMGGSFYSVSAIGAEMLAATLEHGTESAVRQIAGRYDADVCQVRADLQTFVRDLVERGLLHKNDRPPRPRTILACLLIAPLLRFAHHCLPSGKARAAVLLTLAWMSVRLFGWSRTVQAWRSQLCRDQNHSEGGLWEDTAKAVDETVRWAAASHPLAMECKERALACWSLARRAGLPAALVVGIQLFPLSGHCWCQLGPWTLSDDRERCDQFRAVLEYV